MSDGGAWGAAVPRGARFTVVPPPWILVRAGRGWGAPRGATKAGKRTRPSVAPRPGAPASRLPCPPRRSEHWRSRNPDGCAPLLAFASLRRVSISSFRFDRPSAGPRMQTVPARTLPRVRKRRQGLHQSAVQVERGLLLSVRVHERVPAGAVRADLGPVEDIVLGWCRVVVHSRAYKTSAMMRGPNPNRDTGATIARQAQASPARRRAGPAP